MTQPPPPQQGAPLPWGPPPRRQVPQQQPMPPQQAMPPRQSYPVQQPYPPQQGMPPQQHPGPPPGQVPVQGQPPMPPQQAPQHPAPQQTPPPAGPSDQQRQPSAPQQDAPSVEEQMRGEEDGPLDPAEQFRRLAQQGRDRVLDTSSGRKDGLDKCPRCGSTETHYSVPQVALVCGHCRFAWNEQLLEDKIVTTDISQLRGTVTGSAAGAIQAGNEMITLKCQGCGAEVVITADRSLQARCHWCRQVLSINTQIPNGAVPDGILPFRISHEDAVARIREFAGSRRFFALPAFRREFTPENVVGVYMPYMMIDGNLRADLRGIGQIETRRYRVSTGRDSSETRYDAAEYAVGRRFSFTVDDLTPEASSERADMNTKANTNNILNTIQPFDTKLAVGFNPSYLQDFTSEKRDLELQQMGPRVEDQFLSIARAKAAETIGQYDRGVRWEEEGLAVDGSRWLSVYLPVWLYSYYQRNSDGTGFTHFIAVNGRTGETMGSVPVSHPVIATVSCLAGLAAFLLTLPMVGLFFA